MTQKSRCMAVYSLKRGAVTLSNYLYRYLIRIILNQLWNHLN